MRSWWFHSDHFNNAFSRSADPPVFILGDFNTLSLSAYLPALQQYIDCPTRASNILDNCYGNIEHAYKARCLPPIWISDRNVIHMWPKYRRLVKRERRIMKTVKEWNGETLDKLKYCFENKSWYSFHAETSMSLQTV